MKYEIKDIVFDGENKYNPKLYWDLYRIYDAFRMIFKDNNLVSLDEAIYLECNTGVFCFNKILEDDLVITKEEEELLYRKCLLLCIKGLYSSQVNNIINAKNIDELNEIFNYEEILNNYKFGHKYFKSIPDYIEYAKVNYLEKCKNFIPKNIYKQIDNKIAFSYGFVKENIYNQLKEFYNKLEKWLMDPVDYYNKYSLEMIDCDALGNIDDGIYKPRFENENYILESFGYQIVFNKAKILYNNIVDYGNLDKIEGCYVYIIKRNNDNRIEVCVEFLEGIIIIECDSIIEELNFDNPYFKNFKGFKFNIKEEENKFILESANQIIEFNNYLMLAWGIESFDAFNEVEGYLCGCINKNNVNKKFNYLKDEFFKQQIIKWFYLEFKEGIIELECNSVKVINKK